MYIHELPKSKSDLTSSVRSYNMDKDRETPKSESDCDYAKKK